MPVSTPSNSLKVLILGGYGNTGLLIAKLLLQESNAHIGLAARNLTRIQQAANRLNHDYQTDRVFSQQLDAADLDSLTAAFEGVTIVVVASSTIDYTQNVLEAALNANADYLDVQLSSPVKLTALNARRNEIEARNRCVITDGGFHPGVPAAMVRYAATQLDTLSVANISAAFQLNWEKLNFSDATIVEFVDELTQFNPTVLSQQQWTQVPMGKTLEFDFGEPFGKRYCLPMFLEELRSLPETIPSLNEMGFYISGFNWVTDNLIIPITFTGLKVFPQKAKKPMGRFFAWGLKQFSHPPFGAVIQLQAKGIRAQQSCDISIRLTHDDAYVLTAVPAVACLLQYLNGDIRKPGLWFQANLVEPIKFFDQISRLGVSVTRAESPDRLTPINLATAVNDVNNPRIKGQSS